ncbi:UDP-4-amino-4,6-dideoxy-N-acetyl-beta-L-altrosamine N-acetyltransferase [Anaerosinus massiliensis]|uniref:UDP-4-amino-4, 6-dideoxy-N-acetyl-beta-L-altrosamine N-acetyltransferase n=1 Tax=Massilibacillus massiliensis TaxID=1806837 RepID=UPI0018FE447B|nr:UDP-4-amino-4,6-dideoxy-N-acetyl-beta-L-altrosamine N-acetyltransferase [Massilibacillus massiliensis]
MFKLMPIDEQNLKLILQWRNAKRIRECMVNDEVITWQEHLQWFENLKTRNDREVLAFLVENRPVGIVSFIDIDRMHHHCHWGFYIGEENAPKGCGTIMAYYALSYAFEKYKVHKINSEVIDYNVKSINYHRSLGFEQNGKMLDELFREDKYIDLVLFTLFKEKWNQIKENVYRKGLEKIGIDKFENTK